MIVRLALLVTLLGAPAVLLCQDHTDRITQYNVVWESPSADYNGSMPLGNGDIGLNVWVEESGDLLFYIGKTDSWDDNGRLLKVGKIRVSTDPRPGLPLRNFRQELDLAHGTISVRYGEGEGSVFLKIWVDANRPVIQVEIESSSPSRAVASAEVWRTKPLVLPAIEVSDVMFDEEMKDRQHGPTTVEPDSLIRAQKDRIGWYHRNIKSVGPELSAKLQGLEGFRRPDPLLGRTFGAVVTANDPVRGGDTQLASRVSKRHVFSVYVLTAQPAKSREWVKAVEKVIAQTEKIAFAARRKAHERYWRDFWERSWIKVSGRNTPEDDAYTVSRAYALQRFIDDAGGRGRYPIKFNGAIFTVPYDDRPGDADYRQWGPGYWWQNTRLPYYSMCASGDFEEMMPLFRMYGKDLMPLFKYRTRLYLGHGGAFIPECIYFWGDVFTETYGWTPFSQRTDKLQEGGWHKWEWVSGLELATLMLDYYDYTLDRAFLKGTALPTATEILTFFDQQYSTDERGKLLMHPSQACETWWECTNPMPELSGLHAVTERLLSLPENVTTSPERAFWSRLKKKLPALPTRTEGGNLMLAPAEKFAKKSNVENPELYAVFPFRLVSFEKPNAGLGVQAVRYRTDRGREGWRQDDLFMAYLGLADSAREYIVDRARNKNKDSRFPAFWGPNYDWTPDQTHGGVLMRTLQAMVMQTEGKKIFMFPAWPRDWNVDFKLRAPYNTTVEGKYVNGEIKDLKVTPDKRKKDVVISISKEGAR